MLQCYWILIHLLIQNTNELVYNTNKTYKIYSQNNVIANFDTPTDYVTNRPVTNFSYLKVSNPSITVTNQDLNVFYRSREPQNFIPTEGYCYFRSPITPFPTQTTTSMLNTPYFITFGFFSDADASYCLYMIKSFKYSFSHWL